MVPWNSYGRIFLPSSLFLPDDFRVDFSIAALFLFFIIIFLNVGLTSFSVLGIQEGKICIFLKKR